jgi:hypothetical protein
MADNTHSQSFANPDIQDQEHENMIKPDYIVREVGGHRLMIPTAFPLPGIHMHEPDYSKAADMAAGVSAISNQSWDIIS